MIENRSGYSAACGGENERHGRGLNALAMRGGGAQWRYGPPKNTPCCLLRGLPEIDKACCDRRNFIRVYLLDILLKPFEVLRGLGTPHIP